MRAHHYLEATRVRGNHEQVPKKPLVVTEL
jgi:hypothetical protein